MRLKSLAIMFLVPLLFAGSLKADVTSLGAGTALIAGTFGPPMQKRVTLNIVVKNPDRVAALKLSWSFSTRISPSENIKLQEGLHTFSSDAANLSVGVANILVPQPTINRPVDLYIMVNGKKMATGLNAVDDLTTQGKIGFRYYTGGFDDEAIPWTDLPEVINVTIELKKIN